MRRYIRNEQLLFTLRQILGSRNPELTDIYREIVLLRSTGDTRAHAKAAAMLLKPRFLALSILNLFALVFCGMLFQFQLAPSMPGLQGGLALTSITALAVWESFRLMTLLMSLRQCMPYVLVDELFARRILVLQKPSHSSRQMKAAE